MSASARWRWCGARGGCYELATTRNQRVQRVGYFLRGRCCRAEDFRPDQPGGGNGGPVGRQDVMHELSLFTGAGGGLLASHLLGWTPIGYVEWDDYCQRVIAARIRDGLLAPAPIFGDVRAFVSEGYAAAYQGMVDVVSGGFPCQPFSVAGKRAGADDERNMWPATIAVARITRPKFLFFENVPGLLSARDTVCNDCGHIITHWNDERESALCSACGAKIHETPENTFWYFATILRDLAESGYDVRWRVLSAAEVGAPHKRDRLWIVANSSSAQWRQKAQLRQPCADWSHTAPQGWQQSTNGFTDVCQDVADAAPDGLERRSRQDGRQVARSGAQGGVDTARKGEDVADADDGRRQKRDAGQWAVSELDASDTEVADAERQELAQREGERGNAQQKQPSAIGADWEGGSWWATEPDVGRVAHGVAARVDRLKALGNGQVPAVAAAAWRLLTEQ
jgi:DNA (cytosine-5)-methyltransferase 1